MARDNPNVHTNPDRYRNQRADMVDKEGFLRIGICNLIQGIEDQLNRIVAALNSADTQLVAFAALVNKGKRPSLEEIDALGQIAVDIAGTVAAFSMNVANLTSTIECTTGIVGCALRGEIKPLS